MSFDADSFLAATISGSNSTALLPCPVGEYTGIISKLNPRTIQMDNGATTRIMLDVFWIIEDASAKQATGRDEVVVKQSVFLDSNSSGGLDMSEGKNVALGRLREAVGKNAPGEPFSFAMLPGLMAKVSVQHRPDKNDPSVVYAEVKLVTKV